MSIAAPKKLERADDPHFLARNFLAVEFSFEDSVYLRFYKGEFYQLFECWEVLAIEDLRLSLNNFIKRIFDIQPGDFPAVRVTRRLVDDSLEALRAIVQVPGKAPIPNAGNNYILNEFLGLCIPFKNGYLDSTALFKTTPSFIPTSSSIFSPKTFDVNFDPDANVPSVFLEFLEQVFEGDQEQIDTFQEIAGYLFLNDCRFQKAFLIVGPRRSGKSLLARILTAMLGNRHVASPSLGSLGGNFGLQPLVGKTLILVRDARLSIRASLEQLNEVILGITGEDEFTFDRKYRDAETTRLTGKLVIISNEIPRLPDNAAVVASRFICLQTHQSFYGRKKTDLFEQILPQLPAIALWALFGLERLLNRNRFIQPTGARETASALMKTPPLFWLSSVMPVFWIQIQEFSVTNCSLHIKRGAI